MITELKQSRLGTSARILRWLKFRRCFEPENCGSCYLALSI